MVTASVVNCFFDVYNGFIDFSAGSYFYLE